MQYLNVQDFSLDSGKLVLNLNGISLVMFESKDCEHCKKFVADYSKLPGTIIGINFGRCSLDGANRQIAKMAERTTTPLKTVPKFILYNDGTPYAEYSGTRSFQGITSFLTEIMSKLGQKQSFSVPPQRNRQIQQQMPRQQQQMPQEPEREPWKITPSTGVREYETSYGLPYNAGNEAIFLEYERAYLEGKAKGGRK
jgi:hypothetical protein